MAKKIPMNTLERVLYGGIINLNGINFDYNSTKCQWRKPYAITIPSLPTGVAEITVTRSASESDCGQLPETPAAITNGKVLYGDTLTLSGTAEEGYNDPTVSFTSGVSNNKVTGNVAVSVTAGSRKTYAITISNPSYGTVKNGSTVISSGDKVAYGTVLTITPNTATAQYSYSASSSTGTISSNTLTVDGAETITFSRATRSYTITINNPSYGTVKNGSTAITSGTKVNYDTELTITPTAITGYTTTVNSSTGTISSNKLKVDGNETITFSRTANTYTVKFNGNGATSGSMSNQTFTYDVAQALTTNTFKREYTVTYNYNGNGTANTTAKATTSFTGWATTASGSKQYNDKQSVSNLAASGTVNLYATWGTPGSVALPTPTRTGYTFKGWSTSSTALAGITGSYTPTNNVTLYAIWEINLHTVSFTDPSYGTWESPTLQVPYGTTWSVRDNTVTFTRPPNGSTITKSVKVPSPTRRKLSFPTAGFGTWNSNENVYVYDYNYTALTIGGNATGTITDDSTTFAASNSRSVVTFTNTLGGTPGTNSAYSGAETWTISGTDYTGAAFTRTFTTFEHNAQYYYTISRGDNEEITDATGGDISFAEPVPVLHIHEYTITIENPSYGTVKEYSILDSEENLASGATLLYGTKLTITPNTDTAQYNYSVSSSTGTISDNTLTVDGPETITFSRTENTYWVYYEQGTATGGTLPAAQSRTYPNAVTLATNSMTKSNTTTATYTVTFNYNGNGTANTTATATKTRSYTANGWTTTSGSTTRNYANGASFGANSTLNLTLYPCFTQSDSTSSVTLPTPTRANYTFKGWSTSSTATSGLTGSYTPTANVTLYAIWEAAGTTTSLPIIFPEIPTRSVTIYTQVEGGNRIFATSKETEYSGFGDYDECVIDGITVGATTYTTIKTVSALLNTVSYQAKFTGGTLYVKTYVQGTGLNTTTSMKLSADSYSTTATLSGGAKPQLSLGEQDVNRGPTFNDATDTVEVNFDNPNPVAVTAYIDITFGDGSTALSTSRTIAANGSIDLELQVSSSYDQDMGDMEVYLVDPTGTYLDSEPLVKYVN